MSRFPRTTLNVDGQVLVETALSALLLGLTLLGAGRLLHAQWERTRCAHRVFEATRNLLIGGGEARAGASPIQYRETSEFVEGVGRCGDAVEAVQLPKLHRFED